MKAGQAMQGKVIGNRYKLLEQGFQDNLCTVYEALDQAENLPVTIKLFRGEIKHRSLERLLRFRREVENVSKAAHPNLLKILASGEFEGQEYLVTEHVNGAEPLSQHVEEAAETDSAADIMLQVCAGLAAAHEIGVIHQALNPSSILLFQSRAGPTAKLTDFGIGLLLDLAGIKEENEIIRTFGYMSPEATGILRKPIDERSDIYSLGIIFFQLATGWLPYDVKDTSTLIHQHIAQKPPLPTELNPSIPEVIERIILRLIAKDPLDRYQSASGLIADLQEYQRQKAEGKEVIDFEIARSDRLKELSYATRLIGRDKEFDALKSAISQSTEAKGSLCLVYGDPGVGKTRLIDELRGHVHSVGGIFVGGRGYQHEVTTPYNVFNEALDAYIDKLKRVSSEDREATITRMKESLGGLGGEVVKIAPTIVDLIGEPPELVELDPAKERIRFLMTVTKFVLSLGTRENPLAFFLDDLQWADEGSIELLERIAENANTHPITLIASFRDSDVDKSHPFMQAIETLREKGASLGDVLVKPFGIDDTTRIVSEILLEDEEAVLPLAKELHEKTKGNVFFVLELLRSLVDQGIVYFEDNHYRFDVAKLRAARLPTDIVEVVINRVGDISEENQKILSYASVLGKEIQFDLLSDLTQIAEDTVLDALEQGIENQFLVRDITSKENIYFVHERILDAFYQRLSKDERVVLHGQVAHLLEERYKDNPEPVVFELAHHFAQAKIEEKTLHYSIQAGKKAQGPYAHDQAIKLYNAAREILERQDKTTSPEYIDILQNLGTVFRWAGQPEESLEALQACESLIPQEDKLGRAHLLSMMGDTLFENAEIDRTEKVLEQALTFLEAKMPKIFIGINMGISWQFVVQELHAWLPRIFVRKEYKEDPKTKIVVRILFRLGYVYYFTNIFKMVYVMLKGRNTADKLGPCRELSTFNSQVGMVWYNMVMGYFARRHVARGKKIAEDLGDKLALGTYHQYHGTGLYVYKPWETYEHSLQCIELLKGVGEVWEMLVGRAFRAFTGILVGRNLNDHLADVEEMITTAQNLNALQPLSWAHMHKAKGLALLGDERQKTEGIWAAEEGIRISEELGDKPCNLWCVAVLAFAHLRAKNYDEAIRVAERCKELYPTHNQMIAWLLDLFPICAEVYLESIQHKPGMSEEEKRAYLKKARHFCLWACFKAKLFPFIRGWAYQVNGTYKWLIGKKKKAIMTWEKGIAYLREHTQDTYRLASILLEEASFLLKDDPNDKKAREYLVEARELFSQVGGKLYVERADEILGAVPPTEEDAGSREALTMSRQLESLLNVTQAIGSVFDLEELLDKIIDQAMKVTGAERGFLLLYDEEDNTLRQKVSQGVEKELASHAFSFENCKISLGMIQEVEQSGKGVVEGQDGTAFPQIAADLKEYDVKEALCVPLKAKDKPLGMIYLDNRLAGGIFGQDELELMSSFAVQASVSIENARLHQKAIGQERMEQDLEVAGEIQRLFLPKTVEVIENVSINAYYSPAEFIGGDYYDVIKIDDTRYGIIIVDISGHGSGAAIVMSVISFIVHSSAQKVKDTAELMTELNNNLYERLGGEKYATGIFMVYDKDKESFEYTNAGHSSIMLYKKKDDELLELSKGGVPIGIMEDSKYEKGKFKFEQEDLILLQTDGVFETRNEKGKMFTSQRVKQLLLNLKDQEVAEINKTIISEVGRFQGGGPQQDDITLIALKKIAD